MADIKIDVPRKHYANIGVNLGVGEHAARVRDIERAACIEAWHSTGAFQSIQVDDVVKESTGSGQSLMLKQTDVNIEVITDHEWRTGTFHNVRHRQIDYYMSYSYTGQITGLGLVGTVKKPENMEKIPTGIVPENTDW
jgi:hypothetical protein